MVGGPTNSGYRPQYEINCSFQGGGSFSDITKAVGDSKALPGQTKEHMTELRNALLLVDQQAGKVANALAKQHKVKAIGNATIDDTKH